MQQETISHYFTSPTPEPAPAATQGKKQKHLDERERKISWDFHFGPLAKEHVCCACDVNKMVRNDKGSWHAAHIVSRTYLEDPALASNVLYLIPCCNGCNLEMGTSCLFNVLWDRGKGVAICQIAERIYNYYAQMNPQHLQSYDGFIWKLVRGLFGSERHSLGGGIAVVNEEPLYRMLMLHQIQLLQADVTKLMAEAHSKTGVMQNLLKEKHKPGHGGRNKTLWM